jgi:AcrR family transcriptional regulator
MHKKAPIPLDVGNEAREEIIRAAAELFMELGFTATSIDAVAERMGATKGRVYHYYKSKADLYFDIQTVAMERLMREIEPIAEGSGTAAERLTRMALRHTEILLMELPIQKVAVQGLEKQLLATGASRHAQTLRSVIRLRDDYEQIFAEVIDQGVREGDFVELPARLATKPFFGALNWATVWYTPRRLQKHDDIMVIAKTLADYAMRGILKEQPRDASQATPFFRGNLGRG